MLFIQRHTSYADVYAGARNMSKYVKDIVAMQDGTAHLQIFFWICFWDNLKTPIMSTYIPPVDTMAAEK